MADWSRLLASRRNRILVALLAVVIAIRVALPSVIRRVAVAQADKALIGRIELDDVDLSLVTGGITLHGLRVFATELPAPAAAGSAKQAPIADTTAGSAEEKATTADTGSAGDAAKAAPDARSADEAPSPAAASPNDAPSPAAAGSATDAAAPSSAPSSPVTTGRASAASSRAGEGAAGAAPVFSASRLSVQIGFLPLFHRIVEVRRFELEHFAVSLDRAKNGVLVLPAPVPATQPQPETTEGPGWGVLIRRVALRDGRIGFRDFAVGEPAQHIEGTLPTVDAGNLALLITESGVGPGKVALDAGLEDGALHVDVTIEHLPAGPAYESHLTLTNLPIANARVYIPRVGWSDLGGRLDLDLVHRFESQGVHTLRGTVGLRDIAVRVRDLDEPALAWKALGVEIASVDLVRQHADVGAVTLDGLRIVTRPAGPKPLPVLGGLLEAAEQRAPGDPPAVSATDAERPNSGAGRNAEHPDSGGATNAEPAKSDGGSQRPWTWTVAKVALNDAQVRAIGGDGPLDVGIEAGVTTLASAADTHTAVNVALVPASGGHLTVAGDLTMQPLGFDGTLRADGVILAPLTQPIATAQTRLLKGGVLTTALDIAAGASPKAPHDGARIAGTIDVADFDVSSDDPKPFALRWKDLALELREATAPGVLAAGGDARPGPVGVALARFTLTHPEIVATRTETGIALPPALGGAPAPMPTASDSAPATPAAKASRATSRQPVAPTAPHAEATSPMPVPSPAVKTAGTTPPPLDVEVRVDTVAIQRMRVAFSDEAVRPFYRSTLDPIDLGATDLRWPGPFARNVKLTAKGLNGATCTVTGNVAPAGSRLVVALADLPLAPFNPYAAASGYGVAGGTARLDSQISLAPGAYETANKLVLHDLQVTSGEGETVFASQFGMPLSIALSLLTDVEGNIVLDLPIAGDAKGMRTGLGTLIGNALARAILNAVTSPLKLIGAVAKIGEKPASLSPSPIAFDPGRDTVATGEDAKLDQLGHLLAAAPGVKLHLRGETSAEDRRWLQEQALRAKLEKESGVLGSVRHIAERGPRTAALAVLQARAEGKAAEIPEEHKAWFEAQVSAQNVADTALHDLAAARVQSARSKLTSREGIAEARLLVDETTAPDLAARPVVAVGVGSPPPRVPSGAAPEEPAAAQSSSEPPH